MTDEKIDLLAAKVADFQVQIAGMVGDLRGDIRVVLSKMDDHARTVQALDIRVKDIEDAGAKDIPALIARLKDIEDAGVRELPSLRAVVADLSRTKWIAFGLALGSGALAGGGVSTAVSSLIQSSHG